MENIKHIFEPTPLQCGQAVLAMLTNKSVDDIKLSSDLNIKLHNGEIIAQVKNINKKV